MTANDEGDHPPAGTGRPTVALIGCGPSGMFFLHALATRRRDLAESSKYDELASLPLVTCYEASDSPGGMWRSDPRRTKDVDTNPQMYRSMWSNGPKEGIEFSDYTFQEHFCGAEVPTFLPRGDLLDYMLKRTVSVDPDLYVKTNWDGGEDTAETDVGDVVEEKKHHSPLSVSDNERRLRSGRQQLHVIKFRTAVRSVSYDESLSKFVVASAPVIENGDDVDSNSKEPSSTTALYDYCIWAGGQHGKPRIPRSLLHLLRTGGPPPDPDSSSDDEKVTRPQPFKGTVLHSSHMSNFAACVQNKRVVLIGDSSSAEDLALQAVKHDVDKCYVLSRSGYGDCMYMGSWPGVVDSKTGKVNPKVEVHLALPYRVIQNGTGLKCNEMIWDEEQDRYVIDDETPCLVLEQIDTVIFCTGYVPNQDCLSPELQFTDTLNDDCFWTPPPNFKMEPNPLTPEIGEVEPSEELDMSGNVIPGVYRTVQIANPRMMYMTDLNSEYPLLDLDVAAWTCLAFITGEAVVPEKEEMERMIQAQMVAEMHIPYLRWCIDPNYFEALNALGDDHWSDDYDDIRSIEMDEQYARYFTKVLARNMRIAHYPVDLGTYEELNEKGHKHVQIELENTFARHKLNPDSPDAAWKTFRDCDPSPFRSLHTGQRAAPLPGKWLDMDGNGKLTRFTPCDEAGKMHRV